MGESPCSSPSELAIREKGTERLSGSRVIGYNCSALSGTSQCLLLPEHPPHFHLSFFFFGMLLEWKLRRPLAEGNLERRNEKNGGAQVLSGSPATDMARSRAT